MICFDSDDLTFYKLTTDRLVCVICNISWSVCSHASLCLHAALHKTEGFIVQSTNVEFFRVVHAFCSYHEWNVNMIALPLLYEANGSPGVLEHALDESTALAQF